MLFTSGKKIKMDKLYVRYKLDKSKCKKKLKIIIPKDQELSKKSNTTRKSFPGVY